MTDSSNRLTRDAGLAQQHADGVVLGLRVAGAETEHQASTAQPVDGGRGARQQGRMVELVVQHQRPDAQTWSWLSAATTNGTNGSTLPTWSNENSSS